ncbi:hypothetical protein [Solibacillus isronensis]|nr:hypothetical protein [Solibacillus isronensis]
MNPIRNLQKVLTIDSSYELIVFFEKPIEHVQSFRLKTDLIP